MEIKAFWKLGLGKVANFISIHCQSSGSEGLLQEFILDSPLEKTQGFLSIFKTLFTAFLTLLHSWNNQLNLHYRLLLGTSLELKLNLKFRQTLLRLRRKRQELNMAKSYRKEDRSSSSTMEPSEEGCCFFELLIGFLQLLQKDFHVCGIWPLCQKTEACHWQLSLPHCTQTEALVLVLLLQSM